LTASRLCLHDATYMSNLRLRLHREFLPSPPFHVHLHLFLVTPLCYYRVAVCGAAHLRGGVCNSGGGSSTDSAWLIFHWCHSSAERQFVRTVCAYRACRQPELGSRVAVHCRRHPEACASCPIARNGALRRSAHYMSTTSTHPPHISCEDEEDGADARASERRPSKSYKDIRYGCELHY